VSDAGFDDEVRFDLQISSCMAQASFRELYGWAPKPGKVVGPLVWRYLPHPDA